MIQIINEEISLSLLMRDYYNALREEVSKDIIPEISNNRNEAYFQAFKKNPFDTGESFRSTEINSRVTGNLQGFSFLIEVLVNTPYASFFAEPQDPSNPNFKYGARNTAKEMLDIFIRQNNL